MNSTESVYDVICVGAGMGGLTAANILAYNGYKVLIVEKHTVPGGYCTNFKRKDFRFDASTHIIGGCKPGGTIYNILKQFEAENSIEFIELKELYHWIDPNNKIDFHAPVALPEFVDGLVKLFPHEEKGIREYHKKYTNCIKFGLEWKKSGVLGKIKTFFEYFGSMVRFLRLMNKTTDDMIDPYIQDPACKAVLTALCSFFGLSSEKLAASMFLVGDFSYKLEGEGAFYPKGGSGQFSQSLAEIFIKNRGNLLLGTEVTKITYSNKLAERIITRDKRGNEKTFKGSVIIANCDATHFFTDLCPPEAIPEAYIHKIKNLEPSYSVVILFAGLDTDFKKYNIADYERWVTWDLDFSSEKLNSMLKTADYSNLPMGNVTIYSNIDPTCCPPGKSVISCLCYAIPEPFEKVIQEDGTHGEFYKEFKAKIGDQLLEQAAKVMDIPDLASHVEILELATPLTLKRYTSNRGGAFIGWRMTPDQALLNNLPQETPLRNVFLCGHWTYPSGGVAGVMMSGEDVGKKVLKYLKKIKRYPI